MKDKVKDILRDHVHKHEYPIDAAEIWAGVQGDIKTDSKKNRRKLFGLFFSLGLILLLGLNFITNDSIDSDIISESFHKENDVDPNTQVKTSFENKKPTQKPTTKTERSSNNFESTKIISEEKSQLRPSNPTISKTEKIVAEKSSSIGLSNSDFNNVQSRSNNFFATSMNLNKSKSLYESTESTNESSVNVVQKEIDLAGDNSLQGVRSKFEPFGLLDLLRLNSLQTLGENDNRFDESRLSFVELSDQKLRQSKLSLIASAGLFTKVITAHDQAHTSYVNALGKYIIPLENLSIQALLTLPIGNNFDVSTGLNYVLLNEEFNWNGTYLVDENGEYLGASSTEFLTGENYYQEVHHSTTEFNQTKLISVPVLLGYSSTKNRLSYGIKAGVNLNLSAMRSGQVLDLNLIPTTTLDYDQKFRLGLQSKIEVGYYIIPGLEILGDLSWMQLKLNEDILTQSIQSYSLGLGLRKSL